MVWNFTLCMLVCVCVVCVRVVCVRVCDVCVFEDNFGYCSSGTIHFEIRALSLNFLLILLNFTPCTPTPLISPIPLYLPSITATFPPKKKEKLMTLKKCLHGNCSVDFCSCNFTCTEALVWLEASGFYCTINTGSSLGLLSDVLLLLRSCRIDPFMPSTSWNSGQVGRLGSLNGLY